MKKCEKGFFKACSKFIGKAAKFGYPVEIFKNLSFVGFGYVGKLFNKRFPAAGGYGRALKAHYFGLQALSSFLYGVRNHCLHGCGVQGSGRCGWGTAFFRFLFHKVVLLTQVVLARFVRFVYFRVRVFAPIRYKLRYGFGGKFTYDTGSFFLGINLHGDNSRKLVKPVFSHARKLRFK